MYSMWWYLLLYHSKLFVYVENLHYMQFYTIATKLLNALFYIKCLKALIELIQTTILELI